MTPTKATICSAEGEATHSLLLLRLRPPRLSGSFKLPWPMHSPVTSHQSPRCNSGAALSLALAGLLSAFTSPPQFPSLLQIIHHRRLHLYRPTTPCASSLPLPAFAGSAFYST